MREITDVDIALDARAVLAEGPVWDATTQQLIWVDILQNRVHLYSPKAQDDRFFDVGQPVGIAVPRDGGGLALAMQDGFALLDPTDGSLQLVAPVEQELTGQRMNDGACDSAGRFWAGTMSAGDPEPGSGSLYRLDANHHVENMFGGITISNGIGWSPDDRVMYFVDSAARRIDLFNYDADSGMITDRRPFVHVSDGWGGPDGLAIDVEGCVWVAVWGLGVVQRYTEDGKLDAILRLPVEQVTSCAFGGKDHKDLYVSTASLGLSAAELARQPLSGGIFRCDPGVAGLPQHPYAG